MHASLGAWIEYIGGCNMSEINYLLCYESQHHDWTILELSESEWNDLEYALAHENIDIIDNVILKNMNVVEANLEQKYQATEVCQRYADEHPVTLYMTIPWGIGVDWRQ
jgi:hypothetical protein